MHITDEATKEEIREWITNDDSKVGRIASSTPLAMNKQVMAAVWDAVQTMEVEARLTIIHVCNTTLEAELLDSQLKSKDFHGGGIGEQSVVSKEGNALGTVVLLSYARFRQLLEAEVRTPQSLFPCRVVVICEQEPGRNMDAVIARGQFALLARENLVRKPGFNVKMLGLSYRRDGGGDWLKQPHLVMSHLPPSLSVELSLDLTDTYEPDSGRPRVQQFALSNEAKSMAASQAADILRQNKHVLVYGHPDDTSKFFELVEESYGSEAFGNDKFHTGTGRDMELDIHTAALFTAASSGPPGCVVAVGSGSFSVALPFIRVGMVVSISDQFLRRVYDDNLNLVASMVDVQSDHSLLSQRWTGRGRDGQDSPALPHIVEIVVETLPGSDAHFQQGTHDPLRECFVMAAAYPGRPLNLLPIFKAVDDTRDLARRLRAMGLLVYQGHGFELTDKGHRAIELMKKEPSLTIESATALAGIDGSRMGVKVARSILRICFMREMSESLLENLGMGLDSDEAFVSFLHRAPKELVQGGPGRECVDLGLIWLFWATFEWMSSQLDNQAAKMSGLKKPGQNWPFGLRIAEVRKALWALDSWEHLMGLGPVTPAQQDDWNKPLTPSELRIVEQEVARANYSAALVIPFSVGRIDRVSPEDATVFWLRTNKPAKIYGEFDRYLYAHRHAMTNYARLSARSKHLLLGGLPWGIVIEADKVSVTGLMWFDYEVIKSLFGDLNAPDVDPRVREVAMQPHFSSEPRGLPGRWKRPHPAQEGTEPGQPGNATGGGLFAAGVEIRPKKKKSAMKD